eukprot:scaffold234233_cov25-Prasinocladus_malaysianus.AAC.1
MSHLAEGTILNSKHQRALLTNQSMPWAYSALTWCHLRPAEFPSDDEAKFVEMAGASVALAEATLRAVDKGAAAGRRELSQARMQLTGILRQVCAYGICHICKAKNDANLTTAKDIAVPFLLPSRVDPHTLFMLGIAHWQSSGRCRCYFKLYKALAPVQSTHVFHVWIYQLASWTASCS